MRSQAYQLDLQLRLQSSTTAAVSGSGNVIKVNNKIGRSDKAQLIISVEAIDYADGNENYIIILQQASDLAFTTNIEYVGALQLAPNQSYKHDQIAQQVGPITRDYIRVAWILAGTTPSITFSAYLGGA